MGLLQLCSYYTTRQKQHNKVVKDTVCLAQFCHHSRQITVVGSFVKEIWPCSSAQKAFTSRFTDLSRSAQNKLCALRFRGASPGPGCRISTIFRTWGFLQIDSEWTSSRCAVATGNWILGRGAASPSLSNLDSNWFMIIHCILVPQQLVYCPV